MSEDAMKQGTYNQKQLDARRNEQREERKMPLAAKIAIGSTALVLALGLAKGNNAKFSTDKLAEMPQKTLTVESGHGVDHYNADVNPEMVNNPNEIQAVEDYVSQEYSGDFPQAGQQLSIPDFDPSTKAEG